MANSSIHGAVDPTSSPAHRWMPRTSLGWVGLALSAVAFVCWITFPVITVRYRNSFPVVDTWVMPALATFLLDLAAVLNVAAFWRLRDRALLVVAAMWVTLATGAIVTLFVAGEGLAGV